MSIGTTFLSAVILAIPSKSFGPLPTTLILVSCPQSEQIDAAGDDIERLTNLAEAFTESGDDESARHAWERVIALDGDNAEARSGLGHHHYDERWFESWAELAVYRRAEAKRMLEEHGKVRYGDGWAPKDDVPFLQMSWVQHAGEWMHPADVERAAQEQRWLEAGWEQQDLVWVAPEEFDAWREGNFKVGDEWLTPAEADAERAQLDEWWRVPGERFIALTTVDRESAAWVAWWADQTYDDLKLLVGLEPKARPEFLTLNSIEQYNLFAMGDQATQRRPSENSGNSSCHYAYFADGWFEVDAGLNRFKGTGVCYWAKNSPDLEPYGQHAVRHAAALAYLDAIDPSWNAIAQAISNGANALDVGSYWAEKRLPKWFVYGVAVYCERFFEDRNAAEDGDPLWARKWALSNLEQKGGLRDVESVIKFDLDGMQPEASAQLLQEAGLLVAFVLHGDSKSAKKAHAELKQALAAGSETRDAVQDLEQALLKSAKKIAAWDGE